jgi:TatD DNase family protein
VIDSHTHLDLCEPPDAELVAAADAAGVRRMLTVGIDGGSCRAALAAAEAFPQVSAAIGRHPNAAKGFDDADLADLRALAAHERCVAIGETGLDFYREGAPRADQERAFAAQIELARETGKPLVIHTRSAERETLAQLAAEAPQLSVVMHCFSMPEQLGECLDRGYAISFAGNVTPGPAISPPPPPSAGGLLVETNAPYQPSRCTQAPQQPASWPTPCVLAELRGVSVAMLQRGARAQRRPVFAGHEPPGPARRSRLRPAAPLAYAPTASSGSAS